ncbi:group III truncated hemoglobin [Kitasatospora azatica]|uniref:group III truncated hemoglobin n=1 Tax=Kitasatospora azatica TaxID=58347 RepID=UPI001E311DD1|nr:group III truncated hemoglobin [Kitasatospora azatica]
MPGDTVMPGDPVMPGDAVMPGDIGSRADLEQLLRRFYAAAFADPLIGRYFTEVAAMDLEAHLPRITDFWASSLLRAAEYRRNLFAPHAALHAREPLTAAHYGRWVQLWAAAVDGRHQGPVAERAKSQAQRIARTLIRRTTGEDPGTGGPGGFVPLSALLLRST